MSQNDCIGKTLKPWPILVDHYKGGIAEGRDWYYRELELIFKELVNTGYKIVFVPHIHQDVEAIGTILSKLSTNLVRSHTVIAPCLQSDKGTDFSFNIYKNADLVIASRYHANVCSINFEVPTIGLSPLYRVEYTHKQLINNNTSIEINNGFARKLINTISSCECRTTEKLENLRRKTIDFYTSYFKKLKEESRDRIYHHKSV